MAMIVWEGPSEIGGNLNDDEGNVLGTVEVGTPIVVLAVMHSDNQKTGDMIQLYIVRADMAPTVAAEQGLDGAVCGNCIFRSTAAGGTDACYVLKFRIDKMWQEYHEGRAKPFRLRDFRYRAIRFGAYGDPAAVPLTVWEQLADVALPGAWTGYTHQWETCPTDYAALMMASCETDAEQTAAAAAGYRVYRVYRAGETRPANTIPCPWSKDRPGGPKAIQCRDCLKCSGTGAGRRGHVAVMAHGARAGRFNRSLPLAVI